MNVSHFDGRSRGFAQTVTSKDYRVLGNFCNFRYCNSVTPHPGRKGIGGVSFEHFVSESKVWKYLTIIWLNIRLKISSFTGSLQWTSPSWAPFLWQMWQNSHATFIYSITGITQNYFILNYTALNYHNYPSCCQILCFKMLSHELNKAHKLVINPGEHQMSPNNQRLHASSYIRKWTSQTVCQRCHFNHCNLYDILYLCLYDHLLHILI